MNNKNEFDVYFKKITLGYKEQKNYLKVQKSEKFNNLIFKLTKKNLYDICTQEDLNNLLNELKAYDEWSEYDTNTYNRIPHSIINTHYRNFLTYKNNNKSVLEDLIQKYIDSDEYKDIRDSNEYYCQKAILKYGEFINYKLSEDDVNELLSLIKKVPPKKDRKGEGWTKLYISSISNKNQKYFIDILLTLISDLDKQFPEKNEYNKKRYVIGSTAIRQNDWIKGFLNIYLNKHYSFGKIYVRANVQKCGDYLEDRINNYPILTKEDLDNLDKIKPLLNKLNINCKNPENKTLLLKEILYRSDIKDEWNKKRGDENMTQPLNQILYGPPGTGKTYNTVVKAMEIIGIPESNKEAHNALQTILIEQKSDTPKNTDNEYKIVKKEFDKLKDLKQIEFITFHQSYSYEEFVEGIKPEIDWQKNYDEIEQNKSESNNIRYVGKMGIFREICERASNPIMVNISQFNECYQNLVNDINNAKDKFTIPYTKNKVLTLRINTKQNIDIWTGTDTSKQKAGVIKQINIITQKADNTRIRYLPYITNYLRDKYGLEIKEHQNNENYVLIIDEINRGNISKIFGELITLIEEDKRAGEDNAITVTLPYSGEPFSVPNNLYIIGTMNTADRSIALLDTALRRRFDFEEMMPDLSLLKDKTVKWDGNVVNLQNLLDKLNKNICDKNIGDLDKNHQIGHAYLINVDDKEKLRRAFLNKIYPLLEEYFYDEEDKIKEVLDYAGDLSNIFKPNDKTWENIVIGLAK